MSSTSPMRSAQTAARGIMIAMKVAIMTAIRICSEVGQERGERPDLHLAGVDARGAEPQHRDAGGVEHEHHDREDPRLQPARAGGDVGDLGVGRGRTGADSCGSRTNARTTRMPVICSRSTRLIWSMRVCSSRNFGTIRTMISPMATTQHRHADRHQPGQPGVLAQRHDHAADAHDRRGDEHRARHQHEHLDLLHVVGVAGDQRRRAEPVDLAGGERRRPGGRCRRAGRGRTPSRCASRSRRRRSSTRSAAA